MFLNSNNECKIYDIRPKLCRYYPFITRDVYGKNQWCIETHRCVAGQDYLKRMLYMWTHENIQDKDRKYKLRKEYRNKYGVNIYKGIRYSEEDSKKDLYHILEIIEIPQYKGGVQNGKMDGLA
jgi:Fe-S-cluster containining protein